MKSCYTVQKKKIHKDADMPSPAFLVHLLTVQQLCTSMGISQGLIYSLVAVQPPSPTYLEAMGVEIVHFGMNEEGTESEFEAIPNSKQTDVFIHHGQPFTLTGINQIYSNLKVHGNICNLMETNCLVKCLSHSHGFDLRSKVVDSQQPNNLETNYTEQLNCYSISKGCGGLSEVIFTFKRPYSAIDASFIQNHCLEKAKVSKLHYSGSDAFNLKHNEGFDFSLVVEREIKKAKDKKAKDVGRILNFGKYSDASVLIDCLFRRKILQGDFMVGALVPVIPVGVFMFDYGVMVLGKTYITYRLSYGRGLNACCLEELLTLVSEEVMPRYSLVLTKQWDSGKAIISLVVTAYEDYLRNFATLYMLLNFVFDKGKLWCSGQVWEVLINRKWVLTCKNQWEWRNKFQTELRRLHLDVLAMQIMIVFESPRNIKMVSSLALQQWDPGGSKISRLEHDNYFMATMEILCSTRSFRLWDPGGYYYGSYITWSMCYQLWNLGGRPSASGFLNLHLEDKVNFEGGSIDENKLRAEEIQTRVYERGEWGHFNWDPIV